MRKNRIVGTTILVLCLSIFSCEKAYKVQINYCDRKGKDTVWVRSIVKPKPYKRKHTYVYVLESNGNIYNNVCYVNILETKE